MTLEQQRIAIAEKCGFVKHEFRPFEWIRPDGTDCLVDDIPNYPNDLNAMHEAEMSLSPSDLAEYESYVFAKYGFIKVITITASQRAEAFCRVFWPERFEK